MIRERVYEFSFKDGTTRTGSGRDAIDAFARLGLGVAYADKLDQTRDVTPRRSRTRLALQQEVEA